MYLRVGGTRGDTIYYDMDNSGAPPPAGYSLVLDRTLWDSVNAFASAAAFGVVFGINAGAGPRGNNGSMPWSPANALTLCVVEMICVVLSLSVLRVCVRCVRVE